MVRDIRYGDNLSDRKTKERDKTFHSVRNRKNIEREMSIRQFVNKQANCKMELKMLCNSDGQSSENKAS